MTFHAWPEIESFHNIRKFVRADPTEWWRSKELLSGTSTVTYRCKVKLHGTNAAVQMFPDYAVGSGGLPDKPIICQSRENIITPEKDNAGFARWATEAFKERQKTYGGVPIVIYGEWVGPGIQKNVAVSQIQKKCFVVFAARPHLPAYMPDQLIVEPDELALLVAGVPDTYVLPWYSRPCHHGCDTHVAAKVDVDWKQSDEELTKTIAPINDWVMEIEQNDPWVKATFGVDGTGEGLVFYPVSEHHLGFENFQNMTFKAKGEKHKNIKTASPAQVIPEMVASIDAFVDLVLTQSRLEQGANATAKGAFTYDLRQTGKFVSWILTDVQKETQDELEASNLDWKQVQKPLSDKARSWYLTQAKK